MPYLTDPRVRVSVRLRVRLVDRYAAVLDPMGNATMCWQQTELPDP